jgi:simple sugar transport system permease protein
MSDVTANEVVNKTAPEPPQPSRTHSLLYRITSGNALSGVLAVVLAFLVGSVMIAATDTAVRESAGYFFARPGDFFGALGTAVGGAYEAMFRGAVFNARADTLAGQLRPLTETLKYAAPLILAGLGVGVGFRAGLFNIGGRGQMLLAGAAAGWVGFTFQLPAIVHIPLAILAGIAVGAVWGAVAGVLKARTGAHEVIVTIMLNYVAYYLLLYALSRKFLLQAPGSSNPQSAPMAQSAILPKILGDQYSLHLGFLLALVAVAAVWWLLNR